MYRDGRGSEEESIIRGVISRGGVDSSRLIKLVGGGRDSSDIRSKGRGVLGVGVIFLVVGGKVGDDRIVESER